MSTHKKNTTARPASGTPDPAPDTAAAAPDNGSAAGVPVLRNDTDTVLWAVLGTHPGSTTAALADVAGVGLSTARRVLLNWETAGAARSHSDPESPRAAKTWTTVEPATAPEPADPELADPEPADPEPADSQPAAPEPAAPEPAAPEPAAPEPAAPEPAVPAEMDTTNADSCAPDDPAPADPGRAATAVAGPTGDVDTDPVPANPDGGDDAAAAQPESAPRLRSGALRGQVEDFLRDNPGKDFSPHQIGKALNRSSGAVHNALVTLTKGGTAHQTSTAPKRFALASA
ncbi:hypothetical protein HGA13_12200 [Nocardia speluncae]|uniref:Uncharacterized protein n=1 Tax=Nocardia speluncae TaxID=419477 RepID=A0A846XJ42_9NOCA|nr:hypothetical protein [Nocardia speluncae]NKY33834.1 hypothetical protein [Nocardia speluncae]